MTLCDREWKAPSSSIKLPEDWGCVKKKKRTHPDSYFHGYHQQEFSCLVCCDFSSYDDFVAHFCCHSVEGFVAVVFVLYHHGYHLLRCLPPSYLFHRHRRWFRDWPDILPGLKQHTWLSRVHFWSDHVVGRCEVWVMKTPVHLSSFWWVVQKHFEVEPEGKRNEKRRKWREKIKQSVTKTILI